jgi:hypothetical protein
MSPAISWASYIARRRMNTRARKRSQNTSPIPDDEVFFLYIHNNTNPPSYVDFVCAGNKAHEKITS